MCIQKTNVYYLEHDIDWTHGDGSLNNNLFYSDNLHLIEYGNTKLSKEITNLIHKIRNDIGVVGGSTHTHPSISSHISSHSCTLAPPIRKTNHVKIPKWEECEYVHTPIYPSLPSSSSSSSTPAPSQRSSPPTSSSSPPPSPPHTRRSAPPSHPPSSLPASLSQFLFEYNAKNIVKDKTCFKSLTNQSCIDLFITNSHNSFQNTTAISTGLSDFHRLIVTVLKTSFKK